MYLAFFDSSSNKAWYTLVTYKCIAPACIRMKQVSNPLLYFSRTMEVSWSVHILLPGPFCEINLRGYWQRKVVKSTKQNTIICLVWLVRHQCLPAMDNATDQYFMFYQTMSS